MSEAVVLFAHGARDPRWADTVVALAARVAARMPGTPVQVAYLEFMQPDLGEAIARAVAAGARRVHVAPVFLAAGGHVLRDLPRLAEAARARHPGLEVVVSPVLGALPAVLDAMADACVAIVSEPSHGAAVAPEFVPPCGKKSVDAT